MINERPEEAMPVTYGLLLPFQYGSLHRRRAIAQDVENRKEQSKTLEKEKDDEKRRLKGGWPSTKEELARIYVEFKVSATPNLI